VPGTAIHVLSMCNLLDELLEDLEKEDNVVDDDYFQLSRST
jgi:hypothetical protein